MNCHDPEEPSPVSYLDVSSEELAKAAQNNDVVALDSLVQRLLPNIERIVSRMCESAGDREEVVQLSLERLVRYLKAYDPSRPFLPWFTRLVENQVRTLHHQRRLESSVFSRNHVLNLEQLSGPEDTGDAVALSQLRELLQKALNALPSEQRQAFVLRHVDGVSFDTIATATGVSPGAARVRAHRARKAVLTYLQKYETPSWGVPARPPK